MGAADIPHHRRVAASISAGFVSGACATSLGHPLDTLKVHQQIRKLGEDYKMPALRQLYRGLLPPMLTAGGLQAVYFTMYENIKNQITRYSPFPGNHYLDIFLSGSIAGLGISVLTNPVSLVKIQLQTSSTLSTIQCYKHIYKLKGLRGFYIGMTPMLTMECIGRGAYFQAYEFLKRHLNEGEDDATYTLSSRMASASLAGLYSWFLIYPLDVVKSRIQCYSQSFHEPKSMRQVFREIYAEAGIRGLYRGLTFTLMRSAPVASISLPLYEISRKFIGDFFS